MSAKVESASMLILSIGSIWTATLSERAIYSPPSGSPVHKA
jgi:hypothetical protein